MKLLPLLTLPLLLTAGANARDLGNVVFIGDSLTQGGNANPSYRYQVWKTLVDNGAKFTFVGSQNGAHHNNTVNAPDYRQASFSNIHEGHWGWRASWESGSVPIIGGRENTANLGSGTLANWLALTPTYANHAGTQTYTGKTYKPDTAVIILGVNDISSPSGGALRSSDQVVGDLQKMVGQLQSANPKVRVFVSSILPSSALNGGQEASRVAINNALAEKAARWTQGKSTVSYVNTAEGFHPSAMTYDRTHPNKMGEIHIAGTLANAMGIGGRTLGFEIKPETKLAKTSDFKQLPGRQAGVELYRGGDASRITEGSEPGTLRINSGRADAFLRAEWNLASMQRASVSVKARMQHTDDDKNNLVIWLDDGEGGAPAAFLRVYPDRVSWGLGRETTLYHADNTNGFHEYRVVFNGATYSVWRDNLLIAEELEHAGVGVHQNHLFVGNHSNGQSTAAEIKSVNYEKGATYAPVPEPSTYGLIGAGALGALALVRRRRTSR